MVDINHADCPDTCQAKHIERAVAAMTGEHQLRKTHWGWECRVCSTDFLSYPEGETCEQ